jgi:Flp pilus assembly protein TadD
VVKKIIIIAIKTRKEKNIMIMKTKGIKSLAFVAAAGLMTTSCDLLKDVDYTVTPDPLEMHGDSVIVKIDVTIPEKGINKKAYAEIVPMLGTHALKPVTIVGEKATANGTVIPYKPGGKVVYEDVIAYSPDMEVSELKVTGTIYKKGKVKGEVEEMKIADATVITPLLVSKDFRVILAADQFKRVTQEKQIAEINYLKGSPVVRSSEKVDEDIKELEAFLTAAQTNPKIEIKGVKIEAFASIEGEEDRNNTLSTDRSESAKETTMEIAAKRKVANEMAQEDANYSTIGKGEDYVGFKKALVASDMDKGDKDRILRILEMQQTPAAREQAIRDLSTYLYLDNNVFPAQRRSEIVVNYELTGYSDEELTALSKSNIDTLNLEEILFTATLTDDLNEKLRLYKEAERLFPEDYRTTNNVGAVYYMQNKLTEAKTHFNKANGIQENTVSKNNLAAIAGVNGERQNAKDLLAEAEGAGDEVSYNKGILNIQDGMYDDAISNFGGEATYNKALALLLNKDEATAKSTVDESADAETAKGYYLKAIVGARQDNLEAIVSNLKSAFAKDGSLKAKAAKDREFIKYFENASFTAIVK